MTHRPSSGPTAPATGSNRFVPDPPALGWTVLDLIDTVLWPADARVAHGDIAETRPNETDRYATDGVSTRMWEFVGDRFDEIAFASVQHLSLVAQSLVIATVLGVGIAALVYRNGTASSLANGVTAIGLTIPSFALIGLMVAPLGFGVAPAVVVVVFYAMLPVLRNAVVGLAGVDRALVESARGIGMSRFRTFWQVELPIAWPVILSGVRISGQMVMGVAAVAAYVLGPGLGGFIFQGLSRMGGAGATESIVTAVVGVILLALVLDLALVALGRLTTPKGIRA